MRKRGGTPKCTDCGKVMPKGGCCETCKAERRRLAAIHGEGLPELSEDEAAEERMRKHRCRGRHVASILRG